MILTLPIEVMNVATAPRLENREQLCFTTSAMLRRGTGLRAVCEFQKSPFHDSTSVLITGRVCGPTDKKNRRI